MTPAVPLEKAVLVTGAGMLSADRHGIGSAIALALAEAGVSVFAVDRDAARLEATAAIIAAGTNGVLRTCVADVTSETDMTSAAAACFSAFGRIDGLVNVVGMTQPTGLLETGLTRWRAVRGSC